MSTKSPVSLKCHCQLKTQTRSLTQEAAKLTWETRLEDIFPLVSLGFLSSGDQLLEPGSTFGQTDESFHDGSGAVRPRQE